MFRERTEDPLDPLHARIVSGVQAREQVPRAHLENAIFREVPTLSLTEGLRAVNLKLYDQNRGRMVSFAQARTNFRETHRPPAKRWAPNMGNAVRTSAGGSAAAPAESLGTGR